jgi:hypothetical protein
MKPELKLDFCSYEAAHLACKRWHYSKNIPVGKSVKIGCWESGRFVGAIVFGDGLLGPTNTFLGIDKFKVAEITRIALSEHVHPVSRMIRIAIKLLRKRCPGLELIVAFADTGQGHHGGIYQASGFTCTGMSVPGRLFKHKLTGRILHNRAVSKTGFRSHFGAIRKGPRTGDCEIIGRTRKHRYLLPLTAQMKPVVERLKKPYPKRVAGETMDTSGSQLEERGETPTATLQL